MRFDIWYDSLHNFIHKRQWFTKKTKIENIRYTSSWSQADLTECSSFIFDCYLFLCGAVSIKTTSLSSKSAMVLLTKRPQYQIYKTTLRFLELCWCHFLKCNLLEHIEWELRTKKIKNICACTRNVFPSYFLRSLYPAGRRIPHNYHLRHPFPDR